MSNPIPHVLIGSGPHKVICLHGWFGCAANWGPMTSSLDRHAFTYVFMDYRGYGKRKGVKGPYTMAQIAADVLTLADDLGWNRFSLIGHSMGGMAIQHVLADAPKRVQALVGVTPVPAGGMPFDDEGWSFFSGAANDAKTRRAIIDLTTGNRLSGVWLDSMVQASLEQSDAEAVAAYLEAWAKTSFVERIESNPVAVLVVAGEYDPALGVETCKATWMQHYPNARLEILGNSGHYPMEETPVALVSIIEKFLLESADATDCVA